MEKIVMIDTEAIADFVNHRIDGEKIDLTIPPAKDIVRVLNSLSKDLFHNEIKCGREQ
jgi:hypothetical protein